MNTLMILLLILPIISYLTSCWLRDKYLLNYRWLSGAGLIFSSLVGIGLFVILRLINDAGYVRTISHTWLTFSSHSFLISLTLNNFSALMLALWAAGSLVIVTLISTNYFDPHTYRDNSINLSIATLAINGLLITNDLLGLLLFWALLDMCAYRILIRNDYNPSQNRTADFLTITSHLSLIIATFILLSISGTFRIDLILDSIESGAIFTGRLFWPGIMIILAAIFRILHHAFREKPDNRQITRLSDDFIIFSGLLPAGVFLLIKMLPVLPTVCLKGLILFGGLSALIALIIHLTKSDFRQFMRLNTIVQIGLLFMTIGLGAVQVSVFLLIVFFIVDVLLIVLIRDFNATSEPSGFSINLPIRLIIWFNLIGLPLTLAFNIRFLLLQAIFVNSGAGSTFLAFTIGLLGAIFFLNGAVMLRLFLTTNAYKPRRRKNAPVATLTHWIIAIIAVESLYPFFTLPVLNPLTTQLRDMYLYVIQPVESGLPDYSLSQINSIIIYAATVVTGMAFGFILTNYSNTSALGRQLIIINEFMRNRIVQPLAVVVRKFASKLLGFDSVLIPACGIRAVKLFLRSTTYLNRLNERCARRLAKLENVPAKLTDRIFQRAQSTKFLNISGIVLLILLIIIVICII
ncbi:MAG: proton-conducting transporter membrane subunit [Candidatus Neomarinimicrobiota bacterium]